MITEKFESNDVTVMLNRDVDGAGSHDYDIRLYNNTDREMVLVLMRNQEAAEIAFRHLREGAVQ